eukprot:3595721-Alexandrium_andersonii.AAC.1
MARSTATRNTPLTWSMSNPRSSPAASVRCLLAGIGSAASRPIPGAARPAGTYRAGGRGPCAARTYSPGAELDIQ